MNKSDINNWTWKIFESDQTELRKGNLEMQNKVKPIKLQKKDCAEDPKCWKQYVFKKEKFLEPALGKKRKEDKSHLLDPYNMQSKHKRNASTDSTFERDELEFLKAQQLQHFKTMNALAAGQADVKPQTLTIIDLAHKRIDSRNNGNTNKNLSSIEKNKIALKFLRMNERLRIKYEPLIKTNLENQRK